jgi:two-component system, sensor histidine kinase
MTAQDDDTLAFAAEDDDGAQGLPPWTLLVVDDEPDVHAVTRLALHAARFSGRTVRLISAYSAAEGRRLLAEHPDTALILLDVVMESDDAGLLFVQYVRETLGNRDVRIVLRTGQPGVAPARAVVDRYEIDDYRTKTELTSERLHVSVAAALRTYALLDARHRRERALLESNQELERFAYVASHDLQTPLRAVVGYAQLLQRRYAAALDAEGQALLAGVVAGGKDLSRLIRDLLEFSELGQAQRVPQPVALDALLDKVSARLSDTIAARGAVLHRAPLPVPVVQGDGVMLEQALVNLLDNAIKFQPGAAPQVWIDAVTRPGFVEVQVRDAGIGIAPEHLPHVLQGFKRLHAPGEYPGSGLGLALCRKVARLHGGALLAQSTPGTGSVFTLQLALAGER